MLRAGRAFEGRCRRRQGSPPFVQGRGFALAAASLAPSPRSPGLSSGRSASTRSRTRPRRCRSFSSYSTRRGGSSRLTRCTRSAPRPRRPRDAAATAFWRRRATGRSRATRSASISRTPTRQKRCCFSMTWTRTAAASEIREATVCHDVQTLQDLHRRPGLEAVGKAGATHEIKGEPGNRDAVLPSRLEDGPRAVSRGGSCAPGRRELARRALSAAMNEDARRNRTGSGPENRRRRDALRPTSRVRIRGRIQCAES